MFRYESERRILDIDFRCSRGILGTTRPVCHLFIDFNWRIIRFIADVKYNISSKIVKTIATVFKFYLSINKLMTDIVKLLNDLGIDLTRTEHVHYKFESPCLMDLTVETWKERRIQSLKSWAIAYNARNRRKIADGDIEKYHVSEGTALSDAKAVMRELKKHINSGMW